MNNKYTTQPEKGLLVKIRAIDERPMDKPAENWHTTVDRAFDWSAYNGRIEASFFHSYVSIFKGVQTFVAR